MTDRERGEKLREAVDKAMDLLDDFNIGMAVNLLTEATVEYDEDINS